MTEVRWLPINPNAGRLGHATAKHSAAANNLSFDEQVGGMVYMAVGLGYSDISNRDSSAVHWDLRRGGNIDVDGHPFM